MSAMNDFDKAVSLRADLKKLDEEAAPLLQRQMEARPHGRNWDDFQNDPFDPEQTLLHADQRRLHQAYSASDWPGLIKVVFLHTKQDYEAGIGTKPLDQEDCPKGAPHRHILWDWIYEDCEKMIAVASNMNPQMIEGLIHGNITYKCYKNKEYADTITEHAHLELLPSIYVLEIVNRPFINGIANPYAGRLLSWHEWRQAIRDLQRYHDEAGDMWGANNGRQSYDPAPDQTLLTPWLVTIDSDLPGMQLAQNKHPRYLKASQRFEILQDFINNMRATYLDAGEKLHESDPKSPLLDIPIARVPQEVGYGTEGKVRADQHTTTTMSNWLFGLLYSIIRARFGHRRFEIKSYKASDVAYPKLAQTAEYFCSEVAQSLWYQGGANPAYPGTIAMEGDTKSITQAKYKNLFAEVRRNILNSPYRIQTAARVDRLQREFKASLQAQRAEKREDTWVRLNATQDELKKQAEETRKLADSKVFGTALGSLQEYLDKHSTKK